MTTRSLSFVALGLFAATACRSADEASGGQRSPSAPAVRITPAEAFTDEDLVVSFVGESADPDGNPVSYRHRWLVDGEVRDDLAQDVVPAAETSKGETWSVIVTPSDGYQDGPQASAEASVVDSPPEATLTVVPTAPGVTDDVVATAEGADADGDAVTFAWTWTRDGEETSYADATLPAGAGRRGETWTVSVTPWADGVAGEEVEAEVVFGNTAPFVASVTLAPDPATASDTLSGEVGATSDVDGDFVTLTLRWTVDGALVQSGTATTLEPGSFAKHQAVAVEVTPDDGTDEGFTLVSSALEFANSLPSVDAATVDPAVLVESSVAACLARGWADADGDPEGYAVEWTVGGLPVSISETLDGTAFFWGDEVACMLTPWDGEGAGVPATSASVIVANTAPVVSSALLSDTKPTTDEELSVSVAASDDDGDTVTLSYAWSVDGLVVASSETLPGTAFSAGDTVWVTVTPDDGTDTGLPVTSDLATVVNSAPVVVSVSLTPSAAYTDSVLTAVTSTFDVDGDSVTATYAWTVNGAPVGESGSTLDGALYFDKDDEVVVTVTPSDGSTDGVAVGSAVLTVLDSPPSAPGVTVSPADALVGEDLLCLVSTASTDADGDPLSYTVGWTLDGVAWVGAGTTTLTGDTVDGADTASGDTWACTVTPDDGEEPGEAGDDSVVVDPDLVAWYPFSGDAVDESGHGLDGTVHGASPVPDRHGVAGSAWDFDGANDYVGFGACRFAAPLSVVAWVRSSVTNDVWDTVVGWNTVTSPYAGFQIMANGDGQYRGRVGAETEDLLTTSGPDGDGAWHLVVVTRTGAGVVSLYVDGVLEATGASTSALGTTHDLFVGKSFQPDSFAEYFQGSVDDVRIYDVALSAAQVARLAGL